MALSEKQHLCRMIKKCDFPVDLVFIGFDLKELGVREGHHLLWCCQLTSKPKLAVPSKIWSGLPRETQHRYEFMIVTEQPIYFEVQLK